MTIYLYKKTHNKTGLQYLGKTISKDPHKYEGSGLVWKRHLNKHGYDVTTEILRECQTKDELKEWGMYYSTKWNIVESNKWANLKPEKGDGGYGGRSHEASKKLSERMKSNNPMNDPDSRAKISKKLKGVPKSETHKANMFRPSLHPEIVKKRSGKNSTQYDSTEYHFYNRITQDSFFGTQYEFRNKYSLHRGNVNNLVKGRYLSYLNWIIVSP